MLAITRTTGGADERRHLRRSAVAESWHAGQAFGELLHHRLHLAELGKQLVDLGRRGAGPGGDALFARATENFRLTALFARHRLDDRLDAFELLFVDCLTGLTGFLERLADARQHLDEAG